MQENGNDLPGNLALPGESLTPELAGAVDVRSFLDRLGKHGELHDVAVTVDPELEIAALSVALCRQGGPALRFLHPRGYEIPLLTNLFATPARAAAALGGADPEAVAGRWERWLEGGGSGNARQLLSRLAIAAPPSGASLPLLVDGDLGELPALRCWPGDGGRYLTLPLVVTRDPESGVCNWGLYRVQILAPRRAVIAWRPTSGAARHHAAWRRRGQAMPVTVVLGAPPALLWAAAAPFPAGIDETALLARFLGHPIPLAAGEVHGLPFPMAAEVIIEGRVGEGLATEGPFGHHGGAYHAAAPAPLFELDRLRRRPDALLPATVAGPAPQEHLPLAQLTARLFVPLLRRDVPQLLDLAFPDATIFHGCALARMRDDATPAAELCAALRQSELLRHAPLLVLLDEASDPHDFAAAYWRIVNQVRPARDLLRSGEFLNIDARQAPARRLAADPAVTALLHRRWDDYGLAGRFSRPE